MQARATPRMYFCVDVVRKPFTVGKPLKHSVPEKYWKKKRKKDRESEVWNFPRSEEGSGNPQLKNWKTNATTAEKTAFTRTPTLASQYEKTRESRFAPNLLPYTARSREIFSSREWVVNMVYCETIRWALGTRNDCESLRLCKSKLDPSISHDKITRLYI